MKALSIASIIALGVAGSACSQDAETTEDVQPVAETTEAEADVGGSFNLGLPTEMGDAGATNTDGFNLALPNAAPASTDGFNLATDVSASNGLSELPEIDTDIVQPEGTDTLPEVLETDTEEDEPVIRLE